LRCKIKHLFCNKKKNSYFCRKIKRWNSPVAVDGKENGRGEEKEEEGKT
jgi:hypothetical protein